MLLSWELRRELIDGFGECFDTTYAVHWMTNELVQIPKHAQMDGLCAKLLVLAEQVVFFGQIDHWNVQKHPRQQNGPVLHVLMQENDVAVQNFDSIGDPCNSCVWSENEFKMS